MTGARLLSQLNFRRLLRLKAQKAFEKRMARKARRKLK